MSDKYNQGFTLVELVSVVALIGVLMSFSIGRLTGTGGFNEVVVRDGILSIARGVQQMSLGQQNVQLRMSVSGSNVIVSSLVSGAIDSTKTFPSSDVAITAGAVGSGTACGAISSPITLAYASDGEIESVDSDGFPICLNGQSSLCISPAGFVHRGACL